MAVPLSILDRANSRTGSTAADALNSVITRAQHAEELGIHRFWVAEHHAVPGIAGSAPTVLMAALASRTNTIRIGSGGVMLPNHQPLVVAEQAATLQALFPGRIDLGIGRSVAFTAAIRDALRQGYDAAERFEADLSELLAYLAGNAPITARPQDGGVTRPFVLAMGKGIEYAARAGLGVVVGGPALTGRHPQKAQEALQRYRTEFRASQWYSEPYVVASANVSVADTKEAARDLLLPEAWAMAASRTIGDFPPLESADAVRARAMTPRQQTMVEENLTAAIHGTAEDVTAGLTRMVEVTDADEIIITTNTFDPAALRDNDRRLAELFET